MRFHKIDEEKGATFNFFVVLLNRELGDLSGNENDAFKAGREAILSKASSS